MLEVTGGPVTPHPTTGQQHGNMDPGAIDLHVAGRPGTLVKADFGLCRNSTKLRRTRELESGSNRRTALGVKFDAEATSRV